MSYDPLRFSLRAFDLSPLVAVNRGASRRLCIFFVQVCVIFVVVNSGCVHGFPPLCAHTVLCSPRPLGSAAAKVRIPCTVPVQGIRGHSVDILTQSCVPVNCGASRRLCGDGYRLRGAEVPSREFRAREGGADLGYASSLYLSPIAIGDEFRATRLPASDPGDGGRGARTIWVSDPGEEGRHPFGRPWRVHPRGGGGISRLDVGMAT